MTPLALIAARARRDGLAVLAGLHPGPGDGAPPGTRTLLMLGPDGPRWAAAFATGPEARDGRPDPVDRWSVRVIGALARDMGAQAVYPFEGPPWPPVIRWAVASGWCHASPVGMLVHPRAGMWFSCRGVLALPERIALPVPPASPCATCADRPCLTACPVGALGPAPYDVPACAAHLRGAGRATCLASGCAVRHACPAGAEFRPLPSQAARHMAAFLAGQDDTVDKPVDKQSGT